MCQEEEGEAEQYAGSHEETSSQVKLNMPTPVHNKALEEKKKKKTIAFLLETAKKRYIFKYVHKTYNSIKNTKYIGLNLRKITAPL